VTRNSFVIKLERERLHWVVLVSDGAAGFYGIELNTADHYQRPLFVMVLEDQKRGMDILPRQSFCGRESAADPISRDWAKLAGAPGGAVDRTETAELEPCR